MKKISICLLFVWIVLPVFGQNNSSSAAVPAVSAPPPSSVDLLQKSLQSSKTQVLGPASSGRRNVDKNSAKNSSKEGTATQQPAAAAPASKSAPAEVPSANTTASPKTVPAPVSPVPSAPATGNTPAPKASSQKPAANTLDMPLSIGGTVQSVQTSVEPVKRKPAAKTGKSTAQKVQPAAVKPAASGQAAVPTPTEQSIETNNALLPGNPPQENIAPDSQDEEEDAADAELEYAIKMMQQSKEKAEAAGRSLPPPAAKNRPSKVPAVNKKFNPNAFRPGVEWLPSKSTHFDIYTQKRTTGIPSPNMAMTFESSYQTLRRFIPWMMSGRVRVFVYQDHASYLRYEPEAKPWTRAVAYPTRGEIVIYDEPGKTQELKEVFTHELTHIFTQQFFDSHKTGRIMTPLWLDEGLAVFMEDQYSGKEGVWAKDFKTLNFQRNPEYTRPGFGSNSAFGFSSGRSFMSSKKGKPLFFVPFEKFMKEDSLQNAEGSEERLQDWYFQAYTMVRFLLNPAGGTSPSNRMQFEQFTRLIAQGEAVRNPSTGFLVRDSRGKSVYEPYSTEKALGRAYRYNTIENFEDAFWQWANR